MKEVKKLNEAGKIKKNLKNPPRKDNVPVPDAGFAIMRFRADNPGFWILHCHIDFHNHAGMAVVLQVSFMNVLSYHLDLAIYIDIQI